MTDEQIFDLFDNKCGRCRIAAAVCIHEIEPRSLRPDDWDELENRIPLCNNCHRWATDNPKAARRELPKDREISLHIFTLY